MPCSFQFICIIVVVLPSLIVTQKSNVLKKKRQERGSSTSSLDDGSYKDDVAATSILKDNHRNLNMFSLKKLSARYFDPKSVQEKVDEKDPLSSESNTDDGSWRFPLSVSQMPRPINILAFGGSVTWGAKLKDHRVNYIKILTPYPDHADNLAMRATGADYPSLCMESMITDADKNYDLILFDFVLNNTDGFPLLLKRLRNRYPDAVIVYVHIWSLVHLMVEANTGRRPNEIPRIEWNATNFVWKDGDTFQSAKLCGREVCGLDEMSKLVTEVGGHIYYMPRLMDLAPRDVIAMGWFGPDLHHLTQYGHRILANGILQLLYPLQTQLFSTTKQLGTFGHGDQCYNWFEAGQVSLETKGATLVDMLDQVSENSQDKKFVLEIDPENGGEVFFRSKFSIAVPIGLGYMSQREPINYPLVEITTTAKDTTNESSPAVTIDPNKNKSFRGHPHITAFSHVGWAMPGDNILVIKPKETTKYPFRVIGVYLCGVCAEYGDLGTGSQNKLDASTYNNMMGMST